MKKVKIMLATGILATGFVLQTFAQEPMLPEVTVLARNYKYLKSVNNKEAGQPVNLLEHKAAAYDVKNSEFYDDDYDTYYISFYLPQGYILAVYDQQGKLLRSAEKFSFTALPSAVKNAVAQKYPDWSISDDIYQVSYTDANGAQKIYKVVLQNGSKQMRIKTNEKGEFL